MIYTYLLLLFVIPLLNADQQQTVLSGSFSVGTLTRYNQFISTLTRTQSDGSVTVHSAGGAAGGIVSEGQGYGLFISAATAVGIGSGHSSYSSVITTSYNIFKGWKRMCKLSNNPSTSCQSPALCKEGSYTYPCLPHWKFSDDLSSAIGTGPAPDGDEDAILGMVLLAEVTAGSKPTWWNEVANWAYDSIIQFYLHSVDTSVSGQALLKLGTCWGGYDCSNPSYHAPGAWRAMRNFLKNYGSSLGRPATEIASYISNYDLLITTTYKFLLASQNAGGVIPNWYVPNRSDVSITSTATTCSGSGTPSKEYGAEASRGSWRVALDYILFPTEVPAATTTFLDKLNRQLCKSSSFSLQAGGTVDSIFSNWLDNAFIYAPTFTALAKPTSGTAIAQSTCLTNAINKINGDTNTAYYALSWLVISTITLSGDLAKARSLVATNLGPVPPVAPTPVNPTPSPTKLPPVVPTPVNPTPSPIKASPAPVVPVAPSSMSCGLAGCAINPYWVEYTAPSGVTVTKSEVRCSSGSTYTCTLSGSKYQCSIPSGSQCYSPVPRVNGVDCPLTRGKPIQCPPRTSCTVNDYYVEYVPPPNFNLQLATVYCSDGRYIACEKNYSPKVGCTIPTGTTCSSSIAIYNGSPCDPTSSAISETTTVGSSSNAVSSVAIIGIAIGCVVLVLFVVVVIIITRRKKAEEIV